LGRTSGAFNIHGLLAALLAIVLTTGLARELLIGDFASSKKVQITFWNGFTGPDGIVMLDIINRFNKENPDVQVTMQRIPWATYYNKLLVAGIDGRGPEVFVVHADAIPRVKRGNFIDSAEPVFQGKDGIDRNDFNQFVLDRVRFKGKFLGVPLDIHPQGFYCDTDMLKKAGIVDSEGNPRLPKTRQEFATALKAMTIEPTADHPEKQWGFALTNWGANMRNLMDQFDGHYFDSKGNADLNCPENVKALEYLSGLTRRQEVPPPSNGLGWLGFRQKQVGMVWDGVFMLGDLTRVDAFRYKGGMIPTIGNHPGALANSHCLCIRKNLTAQQHDAVVRFIRFISNHSLDWAAAGQIPARVSLRNTERFKAMQVQHAFAEQIPYLQYQPKTPLIFDMGFILDQACEHAIRLQETPKQALDEANTSFQAAIDRDRQEYPEDQPGGDQP
jgi:multiple sugar transport system substrate-binding protein